MNTLDLLTRLKAANGGASDYRISKILGVSHQTVYHWKAGRSLMSNEVGIRAAELLGLDPEKVVIDLEIERHEGDATFPIWQAIRDKLEMAAAPAVVGFLGYGLSVIGGSPMI